MSDADRLESDVTAPGRLLRLLGEGLEAGGWALVCPPRGGARELWAAKGQKRYPILFRYAREARRSMLQALLADAILSGRARAGDRGRFVAIVGAPAISAAMAESIEEYVREVAPEQPRARGRTRSRCSGPRLRAAHRTCVARAARGRDRRARSASGRHRACRSVARVAVPRRRSDQRSARRGRDPVLARRVFPPGARRRTGCIHLEASAGSRARKRGAAAVNGARRRRT